MHFRVSWVAGWGSLSVWNFTTKLKREELTSMRQVQSVEEKPKAAGESKVKERTEMRVVSILRSVPSNGQGS